jgi:hypothetical protein
VLSYTELRDEIVAFLTKVGRERLHRQ